MKLNIELEDSMDLVLAVSRGWQPLVDDESQPMVDDESPQIANPVNAAMFIEQIIPPFIEEYVIREGRNQVVEGFASIFESVKHSVNSGAFDELIKVGDRAGISNLVKAGL